MSQAQSTPKPQRDLKLQSVVRLVKERTPEDDILCHGVTFHLDPVSLRLIIAAQERGQRLYIPRPFLVSLLRYVLVDDHGQLQSAISFITFYPLHTSEEAMFKTVISLDGDIIHQVCAHCLEDATLARSLSTAHYWLIRQLMNRLTFEVTGVIDRIAWGVSGGLTALYLVWDLAGVELGNMMTWGRELAIAVVLPWLLKVALQRGLTLFIPIIRKIALQRILKPDRP